MRIALAQINPIVGDIAGNASLIRDAIAQAREHGAQLVITPELSVIGYPPKDLLLKPAVIGECVEAVNDLASQCTDIAAVIGYPFPSEKPRGRTLYNGAAWCEQGRVAHRFAKTLLPSYDVFDEHRYFEPGATDKARHVASLAGVPIGISVCEDLWNDDELVVRQLYHEDPIRGMASAGARMLINIAASPFVVGKHAFRLQLATSAAKRYGMPVVYCNQVGGNDELVFDGNSCVFDASGRVIAHARDFEPDLLVVDLPVPGESAVASGLPAVAPRFERAENGIASAYHALVLGLRDYCRKCGFQSVVVGLSGGIDSAVTCALCVAALGPENVRGVAMPSRYSSDGSVADAKDLAERLGVRFHVIAIGEPHEAMEKLLQPHFEGRAADATEENVQARLRGVILMAFSNKFGSLVVSTGNKSELAVGYCTLYGDMAGGLAVLNDVPKTMVWQLARWINESPQSPLSVQCDGAAIPPNSITKPPSAELRPDQTDQDTLPPYDLLDQIIERYVEREQTAKQIIDETEIEADLVLRITRLIDLNEYKRKQAAPGLKITGRAFGFGRRMPIAQRYDNQRAVRAAAASK